MKILSRAPQALGLATTAYGISLLARPRSLADQLGLSDHADEPSVRLLSTVFGVRDSVNGLACAFAPNGSPRRLALLLRSAFDAGDAVACVAFLPASPQRNRAAGFAAVWSALALVAALRTHEN